jgi:hypothetical protein
LARNCPKKAGAKAQPKAKGKGKSVAALAEGEGESQQEEAITLGSLTTAPPAQALGAVSQQDAETWNGFTKVSATVDSGAAECVCGVNHFQSVNMVTGEDRAHAGVEYVCADGGRIPNLGEKHVKGLTTDGLKLNVNFQVTPVDRPLISVGRLIKSGHKVEFSPSGGTITHGKSGAVTPFRSENGVYVLDLWVPSLPGGSRQ